MPKYILKTDRLIVLGSNGRPVAGFKVKNVMEGLGEVYRERKGMAVVKDSFAITQADYHGAYYEL